MAVFQSNVFQNNVFQGPHDGEPTVTTEVISATTRSGSLMSIRARPGGLINIRTR